jgi:hypothetical protein
MVKITLGQLGKMKEEGEDNPGKEEDINQKLKNILYASLEYSLLGMKKEQSRVAVIPLSALFFFFFFYLFIFYFIYFIYFINK